MIDLTGILDEIKEKTKIIEHINGLVAEENYAAALAAIDSLPADFPRKGIYEGLSVTVAQKMDALRAWKGSDYERGALCQLNQEIVVRKYFCKQ